MKKSWYIFIFVVGIIFWGTMFVELFKGNILGFIIWVIIAGPITIRVIHSYLIALADERDEKNAAEFENMQMGIYENNADDVTGKRFCTECGAENAVDAKFCVGCGKPMN